MPSCTSLTWYKVSRASHTPGESGGRNPSLLQSVDIFAPPANDVLHQLYIQASCACNSPGPITPLRQYFRASVVFFFTHGLPSCRTVIVAPCREDLRKPARASKWMQPSIRTKRLVQNLHLLTKSFFSSCCPPSWIINSGIVVHLLKSLERFGRIINEHSSSRQPRSAAHTLQRLTSDLLSPSSVIARVQSLECPFGAAGDLYVFLMLQLSVHTFYRTGVP